MNNSFTHTPIKAPASMRKWIFQYFFIISFFLPGSKILAQCPNATATPSLDTICSGTATSIVLTSDQPGTTYTWTSVQTDVVGATDGSGSTIADTLTTIDVFPGSVVYTITPFANSCSGPPITVTIVVNPVPIVTATPGSQTICTGTATSIALTADVAGTTFSWVVTQSGTSGASNGSGTNIVQTLTTVTGGIATYNITPLADGCYGYSIFTPVLVRRKPTVAAAPVAQTICSGTAIGTITITNPNNVPGTTFSWTRDNTVNLTGIAASGSGSTINGTLTNATGVAQTTIFEIVATANSCSSDTTTASVTVDATPTLITTPQMACDPATVDLTSPVVTAGSTPGLTFTYFTDAGATIPYATPTAATTGTYYIVGTTGLGCADTAAVTVTINPSPTVVTTPQSVCDPATVDLTLPAVTAGSTPGLTFTYFTDAGATIPYATPTAATTGTYYIVGTLGTGCADTTAVTVTIDPKPTLVTVPQSVCSPATTVDLTLPAVTAGSTPGLTFTYFTDAGATIPYATPTAATAGTYYIVGTLGSGCSDTASVTVTINAKPTVVTNNPAAVCSPATADLTLPAVTAGSTPGLTFTYFTDAGATTPYVTPTAATAGTYYIVGTTASGCSDTTAVTVTINPAPTVLTTPQSACSPATVDLTLPAVTAGSTPGLIFTYFTDAGATTPYATPTAATVGTYYIVGTLGSGCADTTAVTVTINAQPTLVINDPAAVCEPATVDLTLPAVTAGSTPGLLFGYYTDAGATSPYATPTAATTGTYYIVGTTAGGCSDTAAVNVIVTPKPTVITVPQVICSPDTAVDLTLPAVTAGSTPGLIYTYFTDAAATNPYATPTAATAGTYYIVGTLIAGCTDTTGVTVTVNPAPTVITNNQTVCSPNTVDLTAPAVTLGSTGGLTFTYFTDAAATIPYATPTTATTGTYYIVGVTAAGCYDTAAVTVTINPKPTVVTIPQSACSPSTINLTLPAVTAGSTPGLTFTYYTDAGATTPYLTPTLATAGTYYIVGTLGTGCADTTPVTVTINPKPTVVTNNPAPVCSPETIDLTLPAVTAGSTGGLTFTYFTDAAATNPVGAPAAIAVGGTYYIVGTTVAGCSDTTPVTVTIFPKPLVVTTPQTACTPSTVNLTLPAVTAGSSGGLTFTYFTDAGATIPYGTPTTATTGTYYIVGTAIVSGCSDTTAVTVTINPTPTVITNDPAAVCEPSTIDLTLPAVTAGSTGGLTFTYFTDAGATNPLGTPAAVAVSGTYYIKGTTAAGCFDIEPVTVTINPKPTVVTSPLSLCTSVTVDLTDPSVTSGSTGGLTFSYFTDAGATIPYGTPATAGAGTYYIVGVTIAGCADTTPVTVDSLPVVVTAPLNRCAPTSTVDLSLGIVSPGTTPGLTFAYYTDAAATIAYGTPAAATAGTYYVVGSTADGCTDTASITFTVNPKPTLVITDPDTVCAPSTVNITLAAITAGSTLGLAYSYYTNAAATIVYPTPTTATAGTYYIVGIDAFGCSDTGAVVVTVNPQPTVITTNQSACAPTSTTDLTLPAITAGSTPGLTFTYFLDAGATMPYATPAAATAGTYYIKGTDGAGCTDITAVTFTVNAKPTVLTTPQSTCEPGTINLTLPAVTAGSTGGLVYTYFTDAGATTPYATPTTAGDGTYYIVGTTGAACSDTTAVVVTIDPKPTLVTVPQTLCTPAATADLTLPAVTAGSTPGLTYTYFTDPGATSPYATPAAATPGTYYIVGTTGAGCNDTASVTFTLNPKPTLITNPQSICTPDTTFDLTQPAVTAGSTPGLTLSYYSDAAATIVFATPATATAGTYYIVGVTASGCSDTTAITLTVNPKPTVITNDPPTICSPATADLTLPAVTLGSTGGLTFSYFTDSAATSSYATPTAAIVGTYYIVGVTIAGCYDTAAVVVVSDAIPTVITTPQSICSPATTVDLTLPAVTAGSTAGLTFSYYTDAGATSVYASPTAAIAGTYYIVGATPGGCTDTASVVVTVNAKPTVVTTDQTTCTAPTVDLTLPAVTAGSTPGLTFTYFTDSAATSVYATPAAATSGTYYIVGSTAAGCSDTAAVIVTVNPVPTVVTTPQAVCSPATSVDLTLPGVTAGSTPGLTYTYYTDSAATVVYPTPTTAITGTYYIVGTIAGGCSDTTAITVVVGVAPTVVTTNQVICTPAASTDITLPAVTAGSTVGLTYTYFTDAGATAVYPTPATAGPGIYYIVGTTVDGCSDTTAVTVMISPSPTVVTTPQSICTPAITVDITLPGVTAGSSPGLTFTYFTDAAATSPYGTPAAAIAGTYYIVGTTAAGCSDTASVTVTVNPAPTVVTTPQTACSPATADLTLPAVTAGSTAGLTFTYFTDSTAATPYATPAAATAGTYYIVGTTGAGCSDTAAVLVTVNSTPTLVINDPATACEPVTADLTLPAITAGSTPGLTFTYFTDAGATIPYATPTAADSGTYYIVGTISGCSDTSAVNVTIYPKPTVVTVPQSLCLAAAVDLTAPGVTTGSTPGLTFSYFTDAAATISYPTPTAAVSGTYYIVGVTADGCSDTTSVDVTLSPTVVTNPQDGCSPATVDLTLPAVTLGSTGGLTYTYFTDAGATIPYATPTTATAGTYYIVGTTSDGCSDTASVLVTINPTPTVVTNNPAAVCSPATVDLTLPAVTAGSTAGLTYTYYTDAGATAAYPTPATAGAGTYYIVGTTGAGCADTTAIVVTVNPSPTIVITNPPAACSPATVDITLPGVTAGSTPGLVYTYYTDAGATSVYPTPTAATNGTYYIVGTLGTGCADTASVTVTVNPPPTVVTVPQAACSPATTVDLTSPAVTLGSTAGLTYTYFTDAGATVVYPTPAAAIAGTYYIVGTTLAGCSDTTSVTVTINPKPTVVTNNPAAVCSPSTVDLTLPAVTAGSTAGLIYAYFTNALATIPYFTPSTAVAGTYYIVGVTAAGCSDTTAVVVTVDPSPTVVTTAQVACVPATIDLTLPAVTAGSTAGLIYTYFTDAGATVPYATPVTADSGTYYIVGTTLAGCSDTTAVTVTINPIPTLVTVPQSACEPGTADLTLPAVTAGSTPGLTYTYFTDSLATVPYLTPTAADSGTYYIVGIIGGGCSDTASVDVTINPKPVVVTNNPSAVCSPSTVDITLPTVTTGSTPGLTYTYFTDSLATSVYATPTTSATGVYYIVGTTGAGCSDTTAVTVTIDSTPTVVTVPQSACFPSTVDLTLPGVTAGSTASLTFSYFTDAAATVPFLTPAAAGAGTYYIVGALITGCSDTTAVTVTINPKPTVVTTDPAAVCAPATVDITLAAVTAGSTAALTYTYFTDAGATVSLVTPSAVAASGTYYIVGTTGAGCSDTTAVNVTIDPKPIVITVTQQVCLPDTTADLTDAVVTLGSTAGLIFTYFTNAAATIPYATPATASAGTYYIVGTSAAGCTDTAAVIVIVNPKPIVVTVNPAAVCAPSTVDLTLPGVTTGSTAGLTFTYFTDSLATTPYLTPLTAGAGTYYIVGTSLAGCSDTTSVIVTVNPIPDVTVTGIDLSCFNVCTGSAIATVTGGNPVYTYVWSSGPTDTTAAINDTIAGLCAAGYTVTVTDANGCMDADSVTIDQPSPINTNVITTDVTCNGLCNGTAVSTPSAGTPPYTFAWSIGSVDTIVSGLCVGTYTVIVTDSMGCSITSPFTITALPPVIANPAITNASCGLCNGQVTLAPGGGIAPYAILWGDGDTSTAVSGLCAGLYTVSITDSIGCSTDFSIPISNPGGVTDVTITSTNVTCFGLCDGSVTAVSPVGGVAPYSYLWIPGGETTTTLSNLCAGVYYVQVADSSGCALIDSVTITEPSQMFVNPFVTAATCGSCDGRVTIAPNGGTAPYTVLWNNSSTSDTLSNLCAGIYSVLVTDSMGCSQNVVIPVSTPNGPSLTISSTSPTCNNSCNATASVIATGGTSPYTYLWNDPAAQITSTANSLCAGTYFVQVSGGGCSSFAQVTIANPAPIGFAFANSNNPLCNGSSDGSITVIPAGGTLPYTFSWSTSTGAGDTADSLSTGTYTVTVTDVNGCTGTQINTLIDPSALTMANVITSASCNTIPDGAIDITVGGGTPGYAYQWSGLSNATTQDLTNILSGTYTITVTDTNGCTLADTLFVPSTVTVLADAGNDTAFCQPGLAMLSGAGSSANTVNYQWYQIMSPADSLVGNVMNISLVPPGTTSYYLIADNGAGCVHRDTVTVIVNPLPVASAGADVSIIAGTTAVLGGNPTGPAGATYIWSPSTGLDDPTAANPVASPLVTTTYTVTVTSAQGCVSTDNIIISAASDITFPNGISPNGDGTNEEWIIENIELFPNCVVEIYNRWGELLFQSKGYTQRWNGIYKGELLPVGTYYYIINLNNPLFPDVQTGPITILR